MNDNEVIGGYGIPEWACEIVDKYELGLRADHPLAAVRVLLADAAYDLKEIATTSFRELALTPISRRRLREVLEMLTDAERMSAICDDEAS